MFRNKSKRDDEARSTLQDDIRRCSGYMRAIVETARRLGVDVPGAIVVTVDAWNGWHRSLARRVLYPPQDEE